jgi:two-component system LytT family response regulator
MENRKCLIIDDEIHAIELLSDYLLNVPGFTLLGAYQDPTEGLRNVNTIAPDFLFLDVDMPGLNGIELSKLVTTDTKIIFTTASPNFAIEAFEVNAFDYLLKPISTSRFYRCINKITAINAESTKPVADSNEYFYIKSENKGKMIKINYQDILYVESNNNYVTIALLNQKYNAYLTLTEIATQLPARLFYRVHKSFIINHSKINFIDGNQIILIDKTVLQIGNTYKEAFLNLIQNHTIKSSR